MKISEEILRKLNIDHYNIDKSFFSRRNSVCLVSAACADGQKAQFIYKYYLSGNIENETINLGKLHGIRVPSVLARDHSALCLEYISGNTMLEHLEETELQQLPFAHFTDMFLDFLQQFYNTVPGYIYGDVNLRNFIVSQEGIFGVDLEEVKPGIVQTDIGKAAAFILTYDPADTEYKRETAQCLIGKSVSRFNISEQAINEEKDMELTAIEIRRNKNRGEI